MGGLLLQSKIDFMLLALAMALMGGGILALVAAHDPGRNVLTRVVHRMCTVAPRVGSMTDGTWVKINGIVLLFAGILILLRFILAIF